MEVQYRIEDQILLSSLNQSYGIQAESIHFIPMGDSAYSYRVECANGDRFYLKLFDHQNDRQRKSVEKLTCYLPLNWSMVHQNLFPNISCPIKTVAGDYQTTCNAITIVLFTFIEGETLAEAYPFTEEILAEIAKSVAAIHRITPSIDHSLLLTETYDLSFDRDLEMCLSLLENPLTVADPIKQALREQVGSNKEQILAMLKRVRHLRSLAIAQNKEKVLCHGDLWGGNLIRHQNKLYVIDWESSVIAPPEYDLAGYIGEAFEVFFSAYEEQMGSSMTINPDLLRFYSYRHHLRNLTNWLMNILFRNTEQAQNENDLDMIVHHCMNRWDHIEPSVEIVETFLMKRSSR
ncbi:phosphotransferase family protein [Paenibacillus montanisoli]|uniref:Aminoglycoside phosphotransferase n=1 Tax=Paenibacillus montanisoli TaxID=2081970 RepID=A0A328U729_9BACL|nr:phosphotransferase [Paenibacillus montanisoli]RAP75816.1 aminoglycoside phosphotransferase [Paenibacillus montanisoli]